MSDDHVVYRVPAKVIGGVVALMIGGIVTLLLRAAAGGYGGDALLLVGAIMIAIFGFLLALAFRAVTIVDGDGVTVRQLFGMRHYPWAEIADIRIAPMVGTGARSAALYDADQRQVLLPQVTDKVLGADGLDHELSNLRRRWQTAQPPA